MTLRGRLRGGPLLMPLFQLSPDSIAFPPAELALDDPNGLLAVGGDLQPARILEAYRHGIFPWFDDSQPILWWSPDPRTVLYPEQLHVSRSMRKFMNRCSLHVTCDTAFGRVIDACAAPRSTQSGTWITSDMRAAYVELHRLGHAHSVEVWDGLQLVGGLYGIAIGAAYFGESMFSRRDNASKLALITLVNALRVHGFDLIDCQVHTSHLASLGAVDVPRARFLSQLNAATIKSVEFPAALVNTRSTAAQTLVSP